MDIPWRYKKNRYPSGRVSKAPKISADCCGGNNIIQFIFATEACCEGNDMIQFIFAADDWLKP